MIEVLLLVLALALVVACGLFVAAEFAFVTVDRSTVERAAAAGDRGADGTLAALRTLSTQLSAAQVGITVTNLLIGFLAEPAIADLLHPLLEDAGITGGAATGLSLAAAVTLATGATMIFGELVPKNLAIARPLETARAVQGFLRGFTLVAGPIVRSFNGTANAILRRLGIEPQEELASARSAEELVSLVRRSADQGTLELETATLLQRSLAFGDRRAADVMTPRGTMHSLPVDVTLLDLMALARETGRSRFPVIDRDTERVVGVVHVKHAVGVPHADRGRVTVADIMIEPVHVPATLELDALLEQLRRGGPKLAMVVNEFGDVDGLVTLEDLIEEIVGDVRDEHDEADDSAVRRPDGSWSLSGLLRPDEASRVVGLELPEDEEYETLGGLVGLELGRIPEAGDEVVVTARGDDGEDHRVLLRVTRMDDLRVDRLALRVEEDGA